MQSFSGDFVLTNVLNDKGLFKEYKIWETDYFGDNLDENEMKKLPSNFKSFQFKLRVISLDDACLLYTSPSPRD